MTPYSTDKIPNSAQPRRAFSLVELLVVIAIIVLLISAMVTVGSYVRVNAQIRNTKATILQIVAALEKVQQNNANTGINPFPDSPYEFWLDNYSPNDEPWKDECLEYALNLIDTDFADDPPLNDHFFAGPEGYPLDQKGQFLEAAISIEVMFFFLDDDTDARKILASLPESARTNEDNDFHPVSEKALMEVVDAWGNPLRYRSFGQGNFPIITSAGPDWTFDTADDIISSEF